LVHQMRSCHIGAVSGVRDREWDNIACVHRQQGLATTWSFGESKMGELHLLHERFKQDMALRNAVATCLCFTSCGNFVLLGYSSGHVDRFNIQSGIHRGTCNHGKRPAHKNSLRVVVTDSLNHQTVTGDSKGIIKFKAGELLQKLETGQLLSSMKLNRESGLLALAMDVFTIRVVDIDTRCLVRKFPGHNASITDISFSADSRWLVSVSMDKTGCVLDLPTGQCVDYIQFDTLATSVDLSPASDMMATSHVGDLGIYLWINKTLYDHITLAHCLKIYMLLRKMLSTRMI
jgi:U3 small nucleolar RNA-associated protein 21